MMLKYRVGITNFVNSCLALRNDFIRCGDEIASLYTTNNNPMLQIFYMQKFVTTYNSSTNLDETFSKHSSRPEIAYRLLFI